MWAYCEHCVNNFAANGGCELFEEDASGRDPDYYFTEECANADICYVKITLECTDSKFVFV